MAKLCKLALVKGKVQGVFYRASTREKALALSINGYAKNLADGNVEVLAYGESEAVQTLIDWLWKGPPASRVLEVEVTDAKHNDIAGFEVK